MAKYIYTDKDGNVLREEPKGRGRVKKEAVQNDDGDWVIIEDGGTEAPQVKQTKTVTEPDVSEDDTEESSSSEPSRKYGKKFNIAAADRISFEALTSSMAKCQYYQEDDIVSFGPGAILLDVKSLPLPFLIDSTQPIYGKIEVDLASGNVGFYTFAKSEYPNFLAVNLLDC